MDYFKQIFSFDISTIILYTVALSLLLISFIKDKKKTKMALKKGWKSFKNIIPMLVPLFIIVGVVLTIVTPETIKNLLGDESGIVGVIIGLLVGSVAFMPPFITYPLGAELLKGGAGYPQVAALVTALMSVGIVYLTTEYKFFGWKATISRNVLALTASSVVALVIWVVM
jgi:uncharacterized membrane protein YraQ (UPF0718 family)